MSGIFSLEKFKLFSTRTVLIGFALTLVLSSVSAVIGPSVANAAVIKYRDLTSQQKLKAWEYGRMIATCYGNNTSVQTDANKVQLGELFSSPGGQNIFTPVKEVQEEVTNVSDDWWTWCDDTQSELTKDAFLAWGMTSTADVTDFVCSMGYKRSNSGVDCRGGGDSEGWQSWGWDGSTASTRASNFVRTLKDKTGIDVNNPGNDVLYLFYEQIIINDGICTTGQIAENPTGEKRYELTNSVGDDVLYTGGKNKSEEVTNEQYKIINYVPGLNETTNKNTCGDALSKANDYYQYYKDALIQVALKEVCSSDPLNYTDPTWTGTGNYGQMNYLTACINGFNNQDDDAYCVSEYADKSINPGGSGAFTVDMGAMRDACDAGFKLDRNTLESMAGEAAEQAQKANADANATTSCAIPGIGWLICPVFEFIAGMTDGIYGLIEGLLITRPELFDTDSGTFRAWEAMRNFANVGFVIAFLVIIFSQLSGLGISNYGVKKLLPRLIVTVILVNVSFIISQLAVDISNIVGVTLKDLLDNVPTFSASLDKDVLASGNWFTDLATGVLAGTAALQVGSAAVVGAAAITYFTGVGLLVPVLLAAILAVVITLLILITRQALVILLVVVSPLAFLAMLLPNTEGWFKKWRTVFIAMLILFPTIALLFGGSRLAASVLLQAWGDNTIGQMIALAVMVVPLFFVPVLLKNSLNAVPALGKLATKWQDRANGLAGRKAKEFGNATPIARGMAIRKRARENYRDQKFSESVEKGGFARTLAGGIRWDKVPGVGKYAGATSAADKALTRTALGAADKIEAEEIDHARLEVAKAIRDRSRDYTKTNADGSTSVVSGATAGIEHGQAMLQQALNDNDHVKASAIMQTLHGMGEAGTTAVTSALATGAGNAETRESARSFIKNRLTDMKERDQRLNMWAEGNDGALETGFADHMGSLTDQQKASQSAASLEQAIKNKALDAAKAREILDNENISIKPVQERLLVQLAGRTSRKK